MGKSRQTTKGRSRLRADLLHSSAEISTIPYGRLAPDPIIESTNPLLPQTVHYIVLLRIIQIIPDVQFVSLLYGETTHTSRGLSLDFEKRLQFSLHKHTWFYLIN